MKRAYLSIYLSKKKKEDKNGRKIYVWWFLYCADTFWLQGFVWIEKYLIKIIFVGEIIITDNFFDSVGSLHKKFMLWCLEGYQYPARAIQL